MLQNNSTRSRKIGSKQVRWSMRLWLRSDKRHEQTNERISRVTTAAPAQKPAALTSHELSETPLEFGPESKEETA